MLLILETFIFLKMSQLRSVRISDIRSGKPTLHVRDVNEINNIQGGVMSLTPHHPQMLSHQPQHQPLGEINQTTSLPGKPSASPPNTICFERSYSYNLDTELRMGEECETDVATMCMLCQFGHHQAMSSDDRFAKVAINLEAVPCLRFFQEATLATEHLTRMRDEYSWLLGGFKEFNSYPLLNLIDQITALRELHADILKNLYNLDRVSEIIKSTDRYKKNKQRFHVPKKSYADVSK